MKDTPWLDTLINNNAIDIGQDGQKKNAEKHNHLQKVAGIWSGLAINQNQTNSGEVHRDERDAKRGFNCVVPYGEWEGGDLLLWEIRQRISIQQGQAVFFRGNIISHNAWNIKGVRNCVDLFTHKNVLRKHSEKRRRNHNETERNEIGKARRRYEGQKERRRLRREGIE